MRLLFETQSSGPHAFELGDGWRAGSVPALGLTWVEGHPAPGRLARSDEVATAADAVTKLVDEHLGIVRPRGVSRLDSTSSMSFDRTAEARAFLAGMAAVQLPRCETTRRGHPVHSVSWTHASGTRKLARCYDKGLERGGEPFRLARLEDQRRYGSSGRPAIEDVVEQGYVRDRFAARFGPIRKAVDGVKAASFPVVAQAIADEVRYGYRSIDEGERLAGSLVLLTGGAGETYRAERRRTYYRRRADLRAAGYVVVDDELEVVEVDLGEVVEAAIESEAWR